jgi:translation initiation factor 2 beta subunit (eIF-2beta)/eIF-5
MRNGFIVTNFAYGTGPYMRTTDLAIAFNDELEKRGHKRLQIIIPWVYGEKQKKIMLEEFSEHAQRHPDELLLDKRLGGILERVFYKNGTYEEYLKNWIESFNGVSGDGRAHLSGIFFVETLFGKRKKINGRNIVVELNRSPRIAYGVASAYSTSFAHTSDILKRSLGESKKIYIKKTFLRKGRQISEYIENLQRIHAISYPATFSFDPKYKPKYPNEVLIPPIGKVLGFNSDNIKSGVFVSVTGISGLDRLYAAVKNFGLNIYSNDAKMIPGSLQASPGIFPNKNILFQFARSGWGAVWLSLLSGTPLVISDFDPVDDPEIYFNNIAIEKMGIGIVFRGQSLEDILEKAGEMKIKSGKIREEILQRWGTLDGNRYAAKLFVEDFLKLSWQSRRNKNS